MYELMCYTMTDNTWFIFVLFEVNVTQFEQASDTSSIDIN